MLLLLLNTYKKKVLKLKNIKKFAIPKKSKSYKIYLKGKIITYQYLKKLEFFSYQILPLQYNKIMIIKIHNLNYFKNIYKKIKQKYE